MNPPRIAELLRPFVDPLQLSDVVLTNISMYIDILLRWNARMNLTAIRDPEEIVTRHFGESLFAAIDLYPTKAGKDHLIDLGSGAGFPGIPIKFWAPDLSVTLIESNQKKATFLREVARTVTLTSINVFSGRAEDYPGPKAGTVTLRAVEHFESALLLAANLMSAGGRLALLIGEKQVTQARLLAPDLEWLTPHRIPGSSNRVLLVGVKTHNTVQDSE